MNYFTVIETFLRNIKRTTNLPENQKEMLSDFGEKSRADILIHVDKNGSVSDQKSEGYFIVFMCMVNHYMNQMGHENYHYLIRKTIEEIVVYSKEFNGFLIKNQMNYVE